MKDTKGVNTLELKKISKKIIDYRKEISTIFNEYKRVIDGTSTYFLGEAGDSYRNKFTVFYDKLGIILESLTEFSESLNKVTNNYQFGMENYSIEFKKKLKDIIKWYYH